MSRPADAPTGWDCPKCQTPTYVVDTRTFLHHGGGIRRRRGCPSAACGFRFTTYETTRAPGTAPGTAPSAKVRIRRALRHLREAAADLVELGGDDPDASP